MSLSRCQSLCGGGAVLAVVERARQRLRSAEVVVEHGPDCHRAGEVRQRRVGESPRVRLGPGEQGGDRGDVGRTEPGRVVDQGGVGSLPRRLAAADRNAEVAGDGRVGDVDVPGVGQARGPTAGPELGLHTGGEVLAVEPDGVDRSTGGAAGLLLAEDLVHGVSGVGDLHLVQRDALLPEPVGDVAGDEGVERVVAAVHVPVDGLAAGCSLDGRPILHGCRGSGAGAAAGAAARAACGRSEERGRERGDESGSRHRSVLLMFE